MFTLQPNHQVVYHLSQLSNCVSVTATQVVNGLKTLSTKRQERPLQKSGSVLCNESLDEAMKNFSREMFVNLPKINKKPYQLNKKSTSEKTVSGKEEVRRVVQLLCPLKPLKLERPYQAPWEVSFVSTNSFEENKRLGFHRIPPANPPNMVYIMSRNLHPLLQLNKCTHQVRGFKTERIVLKERERNGGILYQVANVFRTKPEVKPPTLNTESIQFSDAKSVDAVASAFGKVYGEGYTAARNEEKWKKYFYFVYGLLGAIICVCTFCYIFVKIQLSTRLKQVAPEEIDITFDDVRGSEQVKKELQTVVSFLKHPGKYAALGARLPKGVLLVGKPGVGKTLLARAVAGEAKVPFYYASGSEFDEVLVGEGARRIRNLFSEAKRNAPCVIFLDEIDSVGGKRSESSLHPYANQSINQLLSEMDGFQANDGVIVLAATNRESHLDEALVRPGRFDMSIQVPQPMKEDRYDIIKYYLQKIACRNIDIDVLVKLTGGWNGADIENLVNWAAIKAASENSDYVHMHHLLDSYDRIVLGIPWHSGDTHEVSKLRRTAYHEAGHALVVFFTPGASPLHKVTIEARGNTLGHTAYLNEDELDYTKSRLMAQIDATFGGQVAEELIYGRDETSAGCASDLSKASSLARQMVKQFGMSDLPRFLDERERVGGETANSVDKAINTILNESKERVKKLLTARAAELHKLVEALMEQKTLCGDEIQQLFGNREDAKSPKDQ